MKNNDITKDKEFMKANLAFFKKLEELGLNELEREELKEVLAGLQVECTRIGYELAYDELISLTKLN